MELTGDTSMVGTETRPERAKEQMMYQSREETQMTLVGRMSKGGGNRTAPVISSYRKKNSVKNDWNMFNRWLKGSNC